jgi:hypothetical protein
MIRRGHNLLDIPRFRRLSILVFKVPESKTRHRDERDVVAIAEMVQCHQRFISEDQQSVPLEHIGWCRYVLIEDSEGAPIDLPFTVPLTKLWRERGARTLTPIRTIHQGQIFRVLACGRDEAFCSKQRRRAYRAPM